ncbi:MAG: AgmX/PglI C-terminal domain-containing protein [Pseudomonadota bacterium]
MTMLLPVDQRATTLPKTAIVTTSTARLRRPTAGSWTGSRVFLLGLIASCYCMAAAGCGGADAATRNRAGSSAGSSVGGGGNRGAGTDEASEENEKRYVPPEKYEEVALAFRMKRPAVIRCFSDAINNEQIDRKTTGRVTLVLHIASNGSPSNVHVSESTMKGAKVVEDCIVRLVGAWQFSPPEHEIDFSFAYSFEPE